MDQIKSWQLKRLHLDANAGRLIKPDDTTDLLNQIRDLTVSLGVCEGKLKKERSVSKKLRKELKSLK